LIAVNCVTLALFDPLDTECENRCTILNPIDKGLGIYFTLEMAIKMFALGKRPIPTFFTLLLGLLILLPPI